MDPLAPLASTSKKHAVFVETITMECGRHPFTIAFARITRESDRAGGPEVVGEREVRRHPTKIHRPPKCDELLVCDSGAHPIQQAGLVRLAKAQLAQQLALRCVAADTPRQRKLDRLPAVGGDCAAEPPAPSAVVAAVWVSQPDLVQQPPPYLLSLRSLLIRPDLSAASSTVYETVWANWKRAYSKIGMSGGLRVQ